jgi:hypothetical protein
MTQQPKNFMIPLSAETARGLSVLVFLALPLGSFADAIWPEMPPGAHLAAGLVKLVGLLGAALLFLSTYGQKSQQPDSALDERERDERNRAYVATHQIMLASLFGFFIYATIARLAGWWLPSGETGFDLLSYFAIGSMALPGAILAWRDRSVPEEA